MTEDNKSDFVPPKLAGRPDFFPEPWWSKWIDAKIGDQDIKVMETTIIVYFGACGEHADACKKIYDNILRSAQLEIIKMFKAEMGI